MGYDNKYGRITTEHETIPDDEPVVLFRSKDVLFPQLLAAYRALCADAGSPAGHLERIDATVERVREWQASHPTQVPGSGRP
jgi:hypothetical protein